MHHLPLSIKGVLDTMLLRYPFLSESEFAHQHSLLPLKFTFVILSFQVMNLIGDVRGKVAIMVDDMIDTAG